MTLRCLGHATRESGGINPRICSCATPCRAYGRSGSLSLARIRVSHLADSTSNRWFDETGRGSELRNTADYGNRMAKGWHGEAIGLVDRRAIGVGQAQKMFRANLRSGMSGCRRTQRWMAWIVAILALAPWWGCGRGTPETVPVRGRVTFRGGPWPQPGVIHFLPHQPHPGYPSRPGWGHFDHDGQFVVTSWQPGDGLVPGTYGVSVECWEVPESMEKPGSGKSCVPPKYQSSRTSGWVVVVEPGKPLLDLRFDVPAP